MAGRPFIIDHREEFPQLSDAPIVEAVIHWRAPAAKPLNTTSVTQVLADRFGGYEYQEQHEIGAALQAEPGNVEFRQQTHWNGYRLKSRSETHRYIAQLTPTGVIFSRLAKYDCWSTFEAEALRFWDAFVEFADPPVIERLGVRFINQIQLSAADQAATYLQSAPVPPADLALSSEQFFHQDRFAVTGQPYHLNSVRTLQVLPDQNRVLIIDTDAATEPNDLLDAAGLRDRLNDMRYLKNKLFFAYMTGHALARFGRGGHA